MTPDDKRRLAEIDALLALYRRVRVRGFANHGPGLDKIGYDDAVLIRRLLDEATAREDAAVAALREPPVEMVNYIRETSYRDGFFSLRPSLKAAADWIERNTLAAHFRKPEETK